MGFFDSITKALPSAQILGKGGLDITGEGATESALDYQNKATNRANDSLFSMYNEQRADAQPWRDGGLKAFNQLSDNKFMENWQQDPGYQFRMAEGMKAINAGASARGMANSGSTLKALTRFGQDNATAEYDKVYNRNAARLGSLAGIGSNMTSNAMSVSQNYGAARSGNLIGMGNAQAGAEMAKSNRMANMINQGASLAAMAFCDERVKTNVELISKEDLEEMRTHLKPYLFNYISNEYGNGDWVGIMAQDLLKSKLGRTVVETGNDGIHKVNMKKLFSLVVADWAGA